MKSKYRDEPGIIPASGHDIGNYFARFGMANNQIQAVLKMDDQLDFDKLSRAVKLTTEEELVLGCRFVESNPPYWKRIEKLEEGQLTSLEITDKPDEAVMKFLQGPLDSDRDAMIKIRLIRSPNHDTLCVKINHASADGAGAKEYLQLLSKIYSCIDRGEEYIPVPRTSGRKDQDLLLGELKKLGLKPPSPFKDPLKASPENFRSSIDPFVTTPSSVWAFPWKQRGYDSVEFSITRFPLGQLDEMSVFAKARGATINDLVLAATYRAMFDITNAPYGIPMDISITMDLRRYLPDQKAQAIRNLTGGFFAKLARIRNEPFDGTLSRVAQMTKRIKEGRPGLQCVIGAEYAERLLAPNVTFNFKMAKYNSKMMSMLPIHYYGRGFAGISNVGFVSDTPLRFGTKTVTDAYIVPPVVHGPGYIMVVCSYNGVLTLMIGYYKASVDKKDIDGLLDRIRSELAEGCKAGPQLLSGGAK